MKEFELGPKITDRYELSQNITKRNKELVQKRLEQNKARQKLLTEMANKTVSSQN